MDNEYFEQAVYKKVNTDEGHEHLSESPIPYTLYLIL